MDIMLGLLGHIGLMGRFVELVATSAVFVGAVVFESELGVIFLSS